MKVLQSRALSLLIALFVKRCAWGLSSATALMNWILWLISHQQQGGGGGGWRGGPNLQVSAACDPEREVAAWRTFLPATVAEFSPSFYMQMKHWSSIDLWRAIFPVHFCDGGNNKHTAEAGVMRRQWGEEKKKKNIRREGRGWVHTWDILIKSCGIQQNKFRDELLKYAHIFPPV